VASDLRPLFVGEVFYVSANPRRTRRPVSIASLAERPLLLDESSAGIADPTRLQLSARGQATGVHLEAGTEVESADTALPLAALGLGDTYAPQILLGSLDPRLRAVSFDPPLIDAFALISRAGSRLSRPVQDFVDRVIAHLLARIEASGIPP
jgi:LysR substrate binding domain